MRERARATRTTLLNDIHEYIHYPSARLIASRNQNAQQQQHKKRFIVNDFRTAADDTEYRRGRTSHIATIVDAAMLFDFFLFIILFLLNHIITNMAAYCHIHSRPSNARDIYVESCTAHSVDTRHTSIHTFVRAAESCAYYMPSVCIILAPYISIASGISEWPRLQNARARVSRMYAAEWREQEDTHTKNTPFRPMRHYNSSWCMRTDWCVGVQTHRSHVMY